MLRRGDTGDWVGTFEGHKGAVWCTVLDPPAYRVATASADFTMKVWDALTGDEQHTFKHKHIVKSVHFSEDGSRVVTGCNDKNVRIFDLAQPDADPVVLQGHTGFIKSTLFLANQPNVLVSGAADGTLRLWDLRTNSQVWSRDMGAPVTSMEHSRDRRSLTVTSGQRVSFFGAESADLPALASHEMPIPVESASLHPDGRTFVAGGSDPWVRLFDYRSGEEIECNKGHHGPIHALRFSPLGETYASGADDGTIRIWQHTPTAAAAAAAAAEAAA